MNMGHVAPAANVMEEGGAISTVNIGSTEVRFMINPKRRIELDICMRPREQLIGT
jgi:hypothetical protein